MTQPPNSVMLADGTVFTDSNCGFSNDVIWCWLKGRSMADCFALFSDPLKTKEITCLYFAGGMKYYGYTELQAIKKGMDPFGNETVDVRLTFKPGYTHFVEEISVNGEGT